METPFNYLFSKYFCKNICCKLRLLQPGDVACDTLIGSAPPTIPLSIHIRICPTLGDRCSWSVDAHNSLFFLSCGQIMSASAGTGQPYGIMIHLSSARRPDSTARSGRSTKVPLSCHSATVTQARKWACCHSKQADQHQNPQ